MEIQPFALRLSKMRCGTAEFFFLAENFCKHALPAGFATTKKDCANSACRNKIRLTNSTKNFFRRKKRFLSLRFIFTMYLPHLKRFWTGPKRGSHLRRNKNPLKIYVRTSSFWARGKKATGCLKARNSAYAMPCTVSGQNLKKVFVFTGLTNMSI